MRISKDCKYFKNCPFKSKGEKRDCQREFEYLYGKKIPKDATILWSLQVCYALKELIDDGLVEVCQVPTNKGKRTD